MASASESPSLSPSVSPSVSPSASPSEQAFELVTNISDQPVRGVTVVKWEGLGKGGSDVGKEYACPNFPTKSVQVVGTFGGATVALQGSNMPSSPIFAALTSDGTNAISLTSAGINKVNENTYWVRPVATNLGATTDIDVYLICVKEK